MAQRHKDLILLLERPGKADNWRAGSREGRQLAGRVQGRRTTGGQGPGKADNWRAGSREGGQLAGRVQGRRTTGGQGPGKANNWRAGSREGGQLAGKNRKHTNQGGSPPRPPVAPRGLSQESLPTSWPRCFSPLLARQLSHMGFPANPGELLLIFSMLCCL